MEELTLQEKIGQMIIIGFDGTEITNEIEEYILKYKIGGFVLYSRNFKNYNGLIELIKKLNKINEKNKIPLFIAIDQECGRVNRLPKEIENLPSASTIVKTGNIKIVEKSGEIIGKVLRKTGINMNFAPVLDIKRFKDNHAIGNRCYGATKEEVCRNGIAVMKKMQEQGVISVIKHFPGHGATKQDSHFMLPIINKSLSKLENDDVGVFKEAIKNGADIMMVGHLIVSRIDTIYPASISRKFIVQYLKKKIRYRGVVITDDLKMRAIRFLYGTVFAAMKAMYAGNDIILMRFSNKDIKKYLDRVEKEILDGRIKINRIDRSIRKIIKLKEKYITDFEQVDGVDILQINEEIASLKKQIQEKIK